MDRPSRRESVRPFFMILYWAKTKYIGKKERMEGLL